MLSEMIFSMMIFCCMGAVISAIMRVVICWRRWTEGTVRQILDNVVYSGDVELSKSESAIYKGITKKRKKDKEDWIYVKDHHEAIIDRALFEKVQERRKASRETYRAKMEAFQGKGGNKENLFRGILYCGHCGNRMNINRQRYRLVNGYSYYNKYYCKRSYCYGDTDPVKNVKAEKLDEMVKGLIRTHIKAYLDAKGRLKKLNRMPSVSKKRKGLEKDLSDAVKRKNRIGEMMANLYADFSDGIFSEEEYLEMKQGYMREHELLEKQIATLQGEIETYRDDYVSDKGLDAAADKYDGFEELTAEIVNVFIIRITCHASDRFEVEYSFGTELEALLALVKEREGAAA